MQKTIIQMKSEFGPTFKNFGEKTCHFIALSLQEPLRDIHDLIKSLNENGDFAMRGDLISIEVTGEIAELYSDSYDMYTPDEFIEVDRTCLKDIAKAWLEAKEHDAHTITMLRDDKHITIITEYEDKPSTTYMFDYRLKETRLFIFVVELYPTQEPVLIRSDDEFHLDIIALLLFSFYSNMDKLIEYLKHPGDKILQEQYYIVQIKNNKAMIKNAVPNYPAYETSIDSTSLLAMAECWQRALDHGVGRLIFLSDREHVSMITVLHGEPHEVLIG